MPAPPPATESSSSPALDSHHDLPKLVRSALAELNNIPASRRNGNLFFHTTAQKASSYKQTKNRKLMAFMIFAIFMLTINGVLSKSRRPISEMEIWEKKNKCYADIESGLWGEKCKTSMVAKENCALQCLSPVCFELIYESDPLEEGEKDTVRSQEYKYCMHKVSLGESLDGIRGSFSF
ncbi:PREDICTED: uncharacterized protein LOC109163941 isoform X2 [Ipomoea nil]|uniref:uncharacterized protein LOC109163941 isoform X2 n=1 Tax=Ipomoea nil TaxID=35883 RepID=UPI000900F8B6|nr:PREDICTED: uncharacterized protein LOC109163941 isoform X2 [Ipomoea nil]